MQTLKQPYVKNGHTLTVSAGVGGIGGGGRSPCNQGKPLSEAEFRMNPAWLIQPDDHRGRPSTDGDRRGAPGSRGAGLHEDVRRGGATGPRAHRECDWKPNVVWQGQMEEGRRGGRLHPEDGQRRPGLQKAPSEDGGRSRAAETDWKPTLPRHASAEEGRARRGESCTLRAWAHNETFQIRIFYSLTSFVELKIACDCPHPCCHIPAYVLSSQI